MAAIIVREEGDGPEMKLLLNQTDTVWKKLQEDGVVFCKREYVAKKYAESANVFMTIYSWFVGEATRIVPKPDGAEFPYWAQANLVNLDTSGSGHVFEVDVPNEEAIFFDYKDWTKILQFKYLAEDEGDAEKFEAELKANGVDEFKVMTTSFYPMLKQKIFKSWGRLFRNHGAIAEGTSDVKNVSAALWCLRKEWVTREL